MRSGKNLLLTVLLIANIAAFGQTDSLKGWHLRDEQTDSLHGISINKTYDYLKGRKSKQVIVAVIDSGVDTTNEDLKNTLWINPKEIAGNSIDDDKNGYVDDVHGWNFLGGKDGRNIKSESAEATRIYHRYKKSSIKNKLMKQSSQAMIKNNMNCGNRQQKLLMERPKTRLN